MKNKVPTKIIEIEVSKWDQTHMCDLDKKKIHRIKGDTPVDPNPYYHLVVNDDFKFGDYLSNDHIMSYILKVTGGRIPIDPQVGRVISIPHDIGMEIVNKGPDYLDVLEKIGNGDIKVGIEIEHRIKNPIKGKPLMINFDPKTLEVKTNE